jgi:hypothetical protein
MNFDGPYVYELFRGEADARDLRGDGAAGAGPGLVCP